MVSEPIFVWRARASGPRADWIGRRRARGKAHEESPAMIAPAASALAAARGLAVHAPAVALVQRGLSRATKSRFISTFVEHI